MTEAQLAEELGVSRQTVVSIEKGKYDPSLPLATEIARLFRVAIEDIFPPSEEQIVPTIATFVMTDIVGSTPLATALGEHYVYVLGRYREVLIDVFTATGRVVDDIGDATFAVFGSSEDAIVAAMQAQRAIADEAWPDGADVRIRIGIHTGEAFAVGNRFVGLAVHETARVCDAAEAGQILMSETTAAAGSEHRVFKDSGARELQGVGKRRLYAVE